MVNKNAASLGDACEELYEDALKAIREQGKDAETVVSDCIMSLAYQLRQMTACANALENMFRMQPDFNEAEYIKEFMPRMAEAMDAETEAWEWLCEDE